ncbi:hydrolase of the had superfamily [Companilactobacillus mindensis DSM 14500]|uniref:Hydrolase of the had superfamily n=1 Tax=Companilactobacillus mindensis DSM 14500 TaxID=1423770 RepID=A0A0R1QJ93_9LACO|nr:HAD-IIB family hydrolase [Companilactobacillus mindensis]KRL44558.1 hydrolase of the had superfamily [Companilactobacillus mindensis DSM 14500]GEO78202.1 hydrolase [Companilactobacillus mindensis]
MKYIFDIDGTLSFDGIQIDPIITAAIEKLIAANNEVIFASARPIRDLLPMIPDFSAHKLIGANGAMISIEKNIEVVSGINSQDFEFLKKLIQTYNLDYIADSSWNYASKITAPCLIERMIDPNQLAQRIKLNEIIDPIKTIFVNLENQLQKELMELVSQQTKLAVIGLSGEGTVDITATGINKFSTLDRLGVDQYIAFGNDRNDLEMLDGAIRSIWINSKPSLKYLGDQYDIVCEPDPQTIADLITSFI